MGEDEAGGWGRDPPFLKPLPQRRATHSKEVTKQVWEGAPGTSVRFFSMAQPFPPCSTSQPLKPSAGCNSEEGLARPGLLHRPGSHPRFTGSQRLRWAAHPLTSSTCHSASRFQASSAAPGPFCFSHPCGSLPPAPLPSPPRPRPPSSRRASLGQAPPPAPAPPPSPGPAPHTSPRPRPPRHPRSPQELKMRFRRSGARRQ